MCKPVPSDWFIWYMIIYIVHVKQAQYVAWSIKVIQRETTISSLYDTVAFDAWRSRILVNPRQQDETH